MRTPLPPGWKRILSSSFVLCVVGLLGMSFQTDFGQALGVLFFLISIGALAGMFVRRSRAVLAAASIALGFAGLFTLQLIAALFTTDRANVPVLLEVGIPGLVFVFGVPLVMLWGGLAMQRAGPR
jgi:hypothetical protein